MPEAFVIDSIRLPIGRFGRVATVRPDDSLRIMGMGPGPATRNLLDRTGFDLADTGAIDPNEAFTSQSLAWLRQLGLPDDAAHVNRSGGAITVGHPPGMTVLGLSSPPFAKCSSRGGSR